MADDTIATLERKVTVSGRELCRVFSGVWLVHQAVLAVFSRGDRRDDQRDKYARFLEAGSRTTGKHHFIDVLYYFMWRLLTHLGVDMDKGYGVVIEIAVIYVFINLAIL